MKRQGWAAVAAMAVLALLVVAPAASAQTSSSVCGGPNQPCAGTPFAQVPAEGAPAEGAAPGPLARTGVNSEHLLLASVAALAFGCLVLLFVEARESALLLRHERARAGGSS